MIPMIMMPMMSSVTSESSIAVAPIPVVSTPVLVTVPSTQAAVQTTTPCVPTNCPAGYRLLSDQTASPNCYLYSDTSQLRWSEALTACANTPGAYLWKPNDEKEADAVRSLFAFGTNVDIWIGANSPLHNGNYEYAVAGGALSLTNLPFGTLFADSTQEDCIEIEVNGMNTWEWDDESCDDTYRYICEVPRQTCP
ncbi:lectin BRA-3-like [Mytilus edulis]|uniref:lectin BRA-3-like n=1 Tax=Mytilus edulis TaxID=6550 RepID=UPI0039F0DA42